MAKQQSIIIDGIELRFVPRESTDGSRFYVSGNQSDVVGCKFYPDGRLEKVNATPTTCANCKIKSDANRKQRYLTFHDVFGHHKDILVSRAVYLAWSKEGAIPEGYEIDHLNGITTDNCILNLEVVPKPENRRRQKISNKLKAIGVQPKWLYHSILRGLYSLPTEQAELVINRFRFEAGTSDDALTIERINSTFAFLLDELKSQQQ